MVVAPVLPPYVTGRRGTELSKRLLMFLQYLGTQESMASIAQRFGVTISVSHEIIHAVLDLIVPHVSSLYIKWPQHGEFPSIFQGFNAKSPHLPPLVAGAIDCREIPIITPMEDACSYFNRKQFHSIKLQAIVDHTTKFIDVFVGWPGRSHDSRAFMNSPIYDLFDNNPQVLLPQSFILGDSAYPLKTYLMTPFRHTAATQQQRRYNKAVSKARITVECAFGQLANRWRRMQFVYLHSIADICKVTVAACALHNFCKLHNEPVFEGEAPALGNNDGEQLPHFGAPDASGIQRRNMLLQMF